MTTKFQLRFPGIAPLDVALPDITPADAIRFAAVTIEHLGSKPVYRRRARKTRQFIDALEREYKKTAKRQQSGGR